MTRRAALALVCTLIGSAAAWAEEPVVFDASGLAFPCREIKPPEPDKDKDKEDAATKIVMAILPVSATFNVAENTIPTVRYEFLWPKDLQVIDHLPKTQLGNKGGVVGTIKQQQQGRHQNEVNVKFGGKAGVGFNLWGASFQLGGEAGKETRDVDEVQTGVQFEKLPPKEAVIKVGTRNRGQNLYFDLMWHDQDTRTGQTEYAILAEVPKEWKGDVCTLVCTALNAQGGVVQKENFVIGLYMSNDSAARKQVEEKARTTRPATSGELQTITNSLGMKFRLIPSGQFKMGATESDNDAVKSEKPQHEVTITRPFYMGTCAVTQSEYEQVMGAGSNPSYFAPTGGGKDKVQGLDTDRLPVEKVSWFEAVKFCNALSRKEGLKEFYKISGDDRVSVPDWSGAGYRLPTEAEREYACRAGTKSRYWFGDDAGELGRHAWFDGNSQNRTHSVGSGGTDNPFGLHDMHGNVWEWCWDWYEENYYSSPSSNVDPTGPETGTARVLRGGSWYFNAPNLRAAYRNRHEPANRNIIVGFRLSRTYH